MVSKLGLGAPLGAIATVLLGSTLTALVVSGCSDRGGGPAGEGGAEPSSMATASTAADGVQAVTVTGNDELRYEPSVIKAKPGKLRITLRTVGGTPHDLQVGPAKVNTGLVAKGQTRSIEVTLSRGHYDFVCTYHVTSNMVGVIDVS